MVDKIIPWAIRIGLVLLVIALVSAAWTQLWSWMPWSTESQLERAKIARDLAQAEADARGLEAQGQRDQTQRVEADGRMRIEVATVSARAEQEARSAPDGDTPLSAERAARLRRNDVELCGISPDVCGPAPAGAPRSRD